MSFNDIGVADAINNTGLAVGGFYIFTLFTKYTCSIFYS